MIKRSIGYISVTGLVGCGAINGYEQGKRKWIMTQNMRSLSNDLLYDKTNYTWHISKYTIISSILAPAFPMMLGIGYATGQLTFRDEVEIISNLIFDTSNILSTYTSASPTPLSPTPLSPTPLTPLSPTPPTPLTPLSPTPLSPTPLSPPSSK